LLDVSAENVGTDDATGVEATLMSTDPYITILNDTYVFGDIGAGEIVEAVGAFEISIASDVPDMYSAMLDVEFSDGSESSWISTISLTLHAPLMELGSYSIDDSGGNGNGNIDPGETVDILIEISNAGSSDAYNMEADLSCIDPFITIEVGSQAYGDITAGSSEQQVFTISASTATPAGHLIELDVDLSGDLEFSASLMFEEIVGHIPALVLDMDGNGNSADQMMAALEDMEIGVEYSQVFPEDLSLYTSVFLCLGIYSDNHVLTQDEGQKLADYLNQGGNLYMEGGDTWYYDNQTPVHSMFGLNATSDGNSDLGTIVGVTGTFTEGMEFNYSGDNSWIDHIEPVGTAFDIFQNESPLYGTGVAYDEGSYKTLAASHEFGGLDDGASPSTKAELMESYLEFFGMANSLMAMFYSNVTEICENEVVEFYDLSSGGVTSWEWSFEGGQPETSTFQNPQVMYAEAGVYDVTLTVSDGTDSQTLTLEDYITVNVCTGIEDKNNAKISVYPNPNNGIFIVDISNVLSNFVTVKVLNTLSNVVYIDENLPVNGDFQKTIDLSNLDKGLYFLVIENYQGSTLNRIIIR
jgi:PKD repeat protein